MTLFRPHRGGLAESMAESAPVSSLADIRAVMAAKWSWSDDLVQALEDLQIRPYGYDARIGWDTYVVTDALGVVGFTDGPL